MLGVHRVRPKCRIDISTKLRCTLVSFKTDLLIFDCVLVLYPPHREPRRTFVLLRQWGQIQDKTFPKEAGKSANFSTTVTPAS